MKVSWAVSRKVFFVWLQYKGTLKGRRARRLTRAGNTLKSWARQQLADHSVEPGVWLSRARTATLELPRWSQCCALTVGSGSVPLPSPKFCGLSSVWVSSAGMSVLFACCNSPQTHRSNLEMIWSRITLWGLYQWFILTLRSTRW